MNNLMIDIETLGTKPGCVILSIGAVKFGGGQLGKSFYIEIDPRDCQRHGMTIDADTVCWWLRQDIKPPVNGRTTLVQALTDFRMWWWGLDGMRFWANSPSFDLMILNAAYDAVGVKPPWSFRDWRDFRTAREILAPEFDPATVPSFGDTHNALSDAKWQATALMMMGYRG